MLDAFPQAPGQAPVPSTEDGFRRRVSYLRVSLTDRCNLRCRYCMPKAGMEFFPGDALMTPGELRRLLKIFRDLGMTKIRLTGGEPLLRSDLEEILKEASGLGVPDVSLTTNGVLLAGRVRSLAAAGLTRINISLDTFRRDRFRQITGADALESVLRGIQASLDAGMSPVKINMVVMREWNFDEIREFVLFAKSYPVEVRFLELMPTQNSFEGTAGVDKNSFVPMDDIRREAEKAGALGPEEISGTVARVFPLLDGLGKIGFISPVSSHFCGSCNRIRLTARGGLKTCLHGEESVNLKDALREGLSDAEVADRVREALLYKPAEHFIRPERYTSPFLQMSRVGG